MHSNMQVISIESDKNWLHFLSEWEFIQKHIESQRLQFHHVDIGKTGAWGVPLEMDKKEQFPLYSAKIFEKRNDFSMVFIDGRFRLACIFATLLYCKKDIRILVHDFNNRPHYHKALQFLDFIDTCDTLAEFKPKDSIDREKLLLAYKESKYDYE